ncbi:MAG: AAA family ATPase [Aestuariivita sp.]|nr:AAA family ATPase [Aestuariivita sp.]
MTRKCLPIGIQDFETIRSEGFYYVDKTLLIHQLVDLGRHYFLSRPRRFGKSLLLDTMRALFEGRQELFRGLAIHDEWDWSVTHPVLRLSFDGKYNALGDVGRSVLTQLELAEDAAALDPVDAEGAERLQKLLYRLHAKTGQRVVVLVDEYDKPILDVLNDPELARANRDYLRGFYGIIKGSAQHIRFVFVTGISMFSKVSLFSGLNNLEDISLDPRYGDLCGYTDEDIDTVFAPELEGLDRDKIRAWYNGYNWLSDQRVYNPFDVLLLFRSRKFRPHWFETGSPSFLFETLKANSIALMELEGRIADQSLISKFDVDEISVEALLFQTGYLTITEERPDDFDTLYRLDYPNLEVRVSLNRGLLAHLAKNSQVPREKARSLRTCLETNDFESFGCELKASLCSLPYQWHATGDLARYEAWYASLLHMSFRAIGVAVRSEEASSHGRADMVVEIDDQVFVIEFKMAEYAAAAGTEAVTEAAADALKAAFEQMRRRGYGDKYRASGRKVHLIAVACGREERNLLEVRAELDRPT